MRSRQPLATLAVIAAAGLILVALVSADTGNAPSGIARFREAEISHAVLGDYAGAVETWRSRVYLLHRQQVVGTGVIACIRADGNTTIRECQGTFILPRGRIQVAGEIITRGAYQLVVVGGTGIYTGTTGVLTVQGTAPEPRQALVTFFLK